MAITFAVIRSGGRWLHRLVRPNDALPFGRLWYTEVDDAIGYAKQRSRSHKALIRVYDAAGNVIATHEHKGERN